MAKKLTVKTDIGTFTRTTARTYTHIVVAKGYRAEVLEASRLAHIAEIKRTLREYRAVVDGDKTIGIRTSSETARNWDIECRDKSIADGSYAKWIVQYEAELAALEARGVITTDGLSWASFRPEHTHFNAEPKWEVLGWCGRYDLALKLARGKDGDRFRNVRIYTVVDGARVD